MKHLILKSLRLYSLYWFWQDATGWLEHRLFPRRIEHRMREQAAKLMTNPGVPFEYKKVIVDALTEIDNQKRNA